MGWDIERWDASNELAETDDTTEWETPDVIDADWSYVEPESVEIDDYDDYQLEPEPQQSGWGWRNDSPVEYAEPDVIDTSFTFLEPEPDKAPVKRDSWGGGWFGSDSKDLDTVETDSSEIERYTSGWFSSEPDTVDADYEYIDPETRGLENPYQRSTDDFFRQVQTGENEAREASWWAQTTAAASQATDAFSDVANDTTSKTKSVSKTGKSRRREPDALDAVTTWLGFGGGKPTKPDTAQASGSSQPSVQMQGGGGSSSKDYGWYFIAQDDPREDADIHALRHWYFTYEFHDGNEEWPEKDFHAWVQSLKGADYRLYVDAGKQIMDNELVDNLKPGTLKTAYLSMRLEGDSPDAPRNDIIGRVSAAVLRGFSK